jgi:methionine-gamma-lyase
VGVGSFELNGVYEAAKTIMNALVRFEVAAKLGGRSSLVTWPAGGTHAGLSSYQREEAGGLDGVVRLAPGLEDSEPLRL